MTDVQDSDKPRVSRSGRILKKSFKLREREEDTLDSGVSHKLTSSSQKRKMSSELDDSFMTNIKSRRERQSTSRHSSDMNDSLKSSEYSDDESERSLSPVNVTRVNETKGNDPSHSAGTPGRKRVPTKVQSSYSSQPEGKETDLSSSTTESSFDTSEPDPESRIESDQNHGTESLNDESFGSDDDSRDPNGSDAQQKKVGSKRRRGYERDPEFVLQERVANGNRKKGSCVRNLSRSSNAKKNQPKRAPVVNSYTLWRRENKQKIDAMFDNLSFRDVSKKVGEVWRALPEAEKVLWKRKAKQLALRSSTINLGALNGTPSNPATTMEEDITTSGEHSSIGLTPIDSAARLKLLGDCLMTLGMKLVNLDCQPVASGVYSVLLDSLLCSVVPLLSLAREISGLENLPDEVFTKMSDHIAYFLPGL